MTLRTASASVIAGLAAGSLQLARCVRIITRDLTAFGFSDHDVDLSITVDENTPLSYAADAGVISGAIDLVTGLESSNCEIRMPLTADVTREDVLGRRFNQADVWIFDVEWSVTLPQPMPLLRGWIADARIEDNEAVFEVRSMQDMFNMSIGRIISPRCSADFGDTQCGVTKVDIAAVVTSAINSMQFYIDLAGGYANGYFRFGDCEFTHGRLAGTWPFEVFEYEGSTGLVTTLAPMPLIPEPYDELNIRRGCSNVKSSTDASIPTCLSYANVGRFRGFDRVPGSDTYLKVPIPGKS